MKGVLTCPPGANATAAAAGCQPYDETGAMMYTVAILSMFALGIVLLIGAQVSKNPHDSKISQYMKQMEMVRENIKYKRLLEKRSRAAVAAAAPGAAAAVDGGDGALPGPTASKKRRRSHPADAQHRAYPSPCEPSSYSIE